MKHVIYKEGVHDLGGYLTAREESLIEHYNMENISFDAI